MHHDDATAAALHLFRGADAFERASVLEMLDDRPYNAIIALAPHAHPVARTIAALSVNLTKLPDPDDIAATAAHNALRSAIGDRRFGRLLTSWAAVAPAGWGGDARNALIDAVERGVFFPACAAALMGPCDDAWRVLTRFGGDIPFAIRRWGEARPDDPSWWFGEISKNHRQNLIEAMTGTAASTAHSISRCLPWLPNRVVHALSLRPSMIDVGAALAAFAHTPDHVRLQYADIIHDLVQHARAVHAAVLATFASVTAHTAAWTRVAQLVAEFPDLAPSIVIAAPWSDMPAHVHDAILAHAHDHPSCAVIAWACGGMDSAPGERTSASTRQEMAKAFFAALAPPVWNALPKRTKRTWLRDLPASHAWLAVRSLGIHVDALTHVADLDDQLVIAARRFLPTSAALRTALLPIALRCASARMAHACIAALPQPIDHPIAFFCAASAWNAVPPIGRTSAAAIRDPANLGVVVALDHAAASIHTNRIDDCCAAIDAIAEALHGRTWNETHRALAMLDRNARATLTPDPERIADILARPNQRNAVISALHRLRRLPPATAVPALVALHALAQRQTDDARMRIGERLTRLLHDHGADDLFLSLVNGLDPQVSDTLLPLPHHDGLAAALRSLAAENAMIARRFAHAIRDGLSHRHIDAFYATPPIHAAAVLAEMPDDARAMILRDAAERVRMLAAAGEHDPLVHAWEQLRWTDAPLAIALAALDADPAGEGWSKSISTLERRPDIVRRFFRLLRPDIQNKLRFTPQICVAIADLQGEAQQPQGRRFSRK